MGAKPGLEKGLSVAFRTALRALAVAALSERERLSLWLPVLLGCGIGLYFSLPFEPAWWVGGPFVAIAAAGAWLLRHSQAGRIACSACLAMTLGFTAADLRAWWVAAPVIAAETSTVEVTGQVVAVETLPGARRVTLGHLAISGFAPDKLPETVRIRLQGAGDAFGPGDWLRVRARLRPPPPPAAPGAFDFQRQSWFEGLGGVGFALGAPEVVGRAPDDGWQVGLFWLERLREGIGLTIRASLPGDAGAVAAALMVGERSAIPEDVLDAMRDSGLAHLLAISGLHVGLVAGILFFTVRALLALIPAIALNYPVKKWAAVAAILGALGYALVAGATVPTQRAFVMVVLVLAAVLADRSPISMRLVAWAAGAILLISPESLLGASFQLSFAAVVALIAVFEFTARRGWLLGRRDRPFNRIWVYVLGVAVTTLVAGLATGTFAAFHFNRVAVYGLAANLVAVPLTAIWIMPCAVAAFALMPFGLEGVALRAMGLGIEVVLAVAKGVASWPGAVHVTPSLPTWGLAVFALGGLWLCLWTGRWRLLGVPAMAAGLLTVALVRPPDVLISADGRLAAVRTASGGYLVSSLTRAKFERDVWLRRAGLLDPAGRWPKSGKGGEGEARLLCDGLGCVYRAGGRIVAFVRAPEALEEDCRLADVAVVLEEAAERRIGEGVCQGPQAFIGPDDLRRNGAHALWLEPDGNSYLGAVRVESVNGLRGRRPWVAKGRP